MIIKFMRAEDHQMRYYGGERQVSLQQRPVENIPNRHDLDEDAELKTEKERSDT